MAARAPWRDVIVLGATVALAQTLWIALPSELRRNESGDYLGFYEPVARSLCAGRGIVTSAGEPATRYPPGYPFLLACVFRAAALTHLSDEAAIRAFHLLCAGITTVLLRRLARRLWSSREALAVALAWITYPPALWLTRQPSSELPFLIPFFGAALAFVKGWRQRRHRALWFFLAGTQAGIASLIRPIGAGLGILLVSLIWLVRSGSGGRHRIVLSVALLLGNATLVVPWEAFAWRTTGRWVPLSAGSPASVLDGWTYAVNPDKVHHPGLPLPGDVESLMSTFLSRRDEFVTVSNAVVVILQESLARPRAALELVALKAARSWYATDSGRFESATLLIQSVYAGAILLATWFAWRRGGARRRLASAVWLVLAYFWGLTILVLSIARYMVPAIGLGFLLLPHIGRIQLRGTRSAT